ncbi:MAG: zinc ribbon domain-containing protein [Oscillibacter sp.]|nr:zinc ribbon domain-containing protein [Oscillibacter sp.]
MSYFEEMTQKAKAAMSTAAGKAKGVADSAKISAAIIAEKREMDKSYRAIGQWYACEHADGEVPEAIADVIAAVRASQEKIAELQASREAAESAEAAAPEEEEGKVCPVCGKISDTKFCPHCGAPME